MKLSNEEKGLEKTKSFQKATIQNVKLKQINEVWKKHKPQGLGFSDNDVVIINLKTDDDNTFTQSFYCRLKGDGTIGHSTTKASEKRQQELCNFIRRYFSKEKGYNVRNNINSWKGETVDVEKINGGFIILTY